MRPTCNPPHTKLSKLFWLRLLRATVQCYRRQSVYRLYHLGLPRVVCLHVHQILIYVQKHSKVLLVKPVSKIRINDKTSEDGFIFTLPLQNKKVELIEEITVLHLYICTGTHNAKKPLGLPRWYSLLIIIMIMQTSSPCSRPPNRKL